MDIPLYQPDPQKTTRYLFFTGKGGVGKTSLSCASAVKLAQAGKKVLLVSTDPASNLDEVFQSSFTNTASAVSGVSGLFAININPLSAAAAYRERLIAPLRGLLPVAALASMEEQLSGSCTVEIAAFDEFSALIGDPQITQSYDHIIFDTAPTGHTLRLMSLAKAWDQFLSENSSGTSCLGPLAGLQKQRVIYENTVKIFADPTASTVVLVSRPRVADLREAERSSNELRNLGVSNQCLLINAFFETSCAGDKTAEAMQQRGMDAILSAKQFIQSMPTFKVPLKAINILGVAGLSLLLSTEDGSAGSRFIESASTGPSDPKMESLEQLIDIIEPQGHGVIMTMGKGGVGKTTIAAAIAVILAKRGKAVHLSTTDPAAHLNQTLAGEIPGLTVTRIDPIAETLAYRTEVMQAQSAAGLDEAALSLLEEDLRSPCTEEIAVFRAFAREVGKGVDRFVVLDTAPTGHTLLLLDASRAYQRELERQGRSNSQPQEVLNLIDRLRDPVFTRIILVTLPEATPVHEASALQDDLRRAGIEPFAWVINQSLLRSSSQDALLQQREQSEHKYLNEVVKKYSKTHTACLPWQVEEPIGVTALERLAKSII